MMFDEDDDDDRSYSNSVEEEDNTIDDDYYYGYVLLEEQEQEDAFETGGGHHHQSRRATISTKHQQHQVGAEEEEISSAHSNYHRQCDNKERWMIFSLKLFVVCMSICYLVTQLAMLDWVVSRPPFPSYSTTHVVHNKKEEEELTQKKKKKKKKQILPLRHIMINVVILTDDEQQNFDRFSSQQKHVLVAFYADWCTFSQALMPAYNQLALRHNYYGDEDDDVVVAAVDCVSSPALCKKEKIRAFPTIRWYENGQAVAPDYKADRTLEALTAYVERMVERTDPPPLLSDWEFHAHDKNDDYVNEEEAIIADDEEDAADDYFVEHRSVVEVEASEPHQDAITHDHRLPDAAGRIMIPAEQVMKDVTILTQHTFDAFLQDHAHVLVVFYADWCCWSQRLMPTWNELALQQLPLAGGDGDDAVAVVAVDCSDEKTEEKTDGMQMPFSRRQRVYAFPTIRWYEQGRVAGPDYKKDRTVDALSAYIQRMLTYGVEDLSPIEEDEMDDDFSTQEKYDDDEEEEEGERAHGGEEALSLIKTGRNQEASGSGFELHSVEHPDKLFNKFGNVKRLTMTTFDQVLKENRAVFVNYGTSWCVWCRHLVPTWEELAIAMQEESVLVAAVDCTEEADLCRREQIIAFPTIRLHVNGVLVSAHYKGEQTVEALMLYARRRLAAVPINERNGIEFQVQGADDEITESPPQGQELETDQDIRQDIAGEVGDNGSDDVMKDVELLTKKTFDSFITNHPHLLVVFYADWCVWSQRLLPTWNKLARAMATNTDVAVVAVNCSEEVKEKRSTLCRKDMGFPTIRWYEKGQAARQDYKMDRTVDALAAYIERMLNFYGDRRSRGEQPSRYYSLNA